MAMRKFQIVAPPPAGDPETRERQRSQAIIGGSLEKRRAFGKATTIAGRFILDPIFRPDDQERLRVACSPDDPRPLVIEIGFQMGKFAAAWCLLHPEARFVGFEVRRKFCQEADAWLTRQGVENALLALVDAREMIPLVLQPGTLDQLFVFFPDPWWKMKQAKRRLISPEFVAQAATWLRPSGRLVLKTDVIGYADWAERELRQQPAFAVTRLDDPSAGLPPTLRESRCRLRDLPTWAIEAVRRPDTAVLPPA